MKKIMFINWKFKKNNIAITEIKKYSTDGDEGHSLLISNFNQYRKSLFEEELAKMFKESNDVQIAIFLHKSNFILIDNIAKSIPKDRSVKVFEFGGGYETGDLIYHHNSQNPKGLLGDSNTFTENCIIKNKVDTINQDHFNFVWAYYWNKLDLEYQKKKMINLWLPLAIDVQGLSEVENIEKRNSYLNEVKEELNKKENGKSYAETLTEGWNEVKKILLPDDGKQVLEEKYQIKEEEKDKIKFPIEREKDDQGQYKKIQVDTLKQFIEENWKKKDEKLGKENDPKFIPEFLPNWLQAVVDIIDKKITEKTS